jgi:hypothetical protein
VQRSPYEMANCVGFLRSAIRNELLLPETQIPPRFQSRF